MFIVTGDKNTDESLIKFKNFWCGYVFKIKGKYFLKVGEGLILGSFNTYCINDQTWLDFGGEVRVKPVVLEVREVGEKG